MTDLDDNEPGPEGRRPRLLLLTPDFPPARGGVQVVAHRLATGMPAFEVRAVALGGGEPAGFDAALGGGLDVRRVARPPGGAVPANALLNAIALAEARRFRPDVTLSVHIVTSPAAALVRRARGTPTMQYFYAKEIPDKARLAAFAAAHADAIVSISSYTSGLLREVGVPAGRITLLTPGVDIPAEVAPLPAERPTIVTVARMSDRYKGHDVLLAALAIVRRRVPDVQWVVIGDGPLRPELEALARAEGVAGAVRFLGSVGDVERDTWLRRAVLMAMPSRLPGEGRAGEGFGIVYLEAAAYGKPVVAGNCAGALDAVLDGVTGLLVDPADPAAVAEAITTLMLDRGLAARLGRAGAERARTMSWPDAARRVQERLLGLLGDGSARGASRTPSHRRGAT